MKRPVPAVAVVACLIVGSPWVQADEKSAPNAAQLSKQATERARAVTLPPIKPAELTPEQRQAMQAAAESARNRAKDELSRLAETSPFTPPAPTDTPSSENPAVEKGQPKNLAGRVVVALSSSMPDSEWAEYMAQLDGKPEALVVLRGFIGGGRTVMETGKLIERVRRVKADLPKGGHRNVEVVVDPLLYRNLGIDKVPAVVWLPGVSEVSHCDGKDFEAAVTVYGTVSVSYALDQINRNGGSVPASILKKFGG